MDTLWKDLRFAVRVLRKSPGFTAVVILSLALGIGATTAVYTAFNAYFLRPMPVDSPGPPAGDLRLRSARWSERRRIFHAAVEGFQRSGYRLLRLVGSTGLPMSMTDGDKPELIWGEIVTGQLFFGARRASRGGPRIPPGGGPEARRKTGLRAQLQFLAAPLPRGSRRSLGKTIRIEGHTFTIVGVAPRGFIGTVLVQLRAGRVGPGRRCRKPSPPILTIRIAGICAG